MSSDGTGELMSTYLNMRRTARDESDAGIILPRSSYKIDIHRDLFDLYYTPRFL